MSRYFLPFFLILMSARLFSQPIPESIRDDVSRDVLLGLYGDALDKLESQVPAICKDTTGLFDALVNLYLFEKNWADLIGVYQYHTCQKGEDTTALSLARFYVQCGGEQIGGLPASVPFKPSVSGTPEIAVKINGRLYHFWFDTGAGITVLSSRTAARCKVKTSIANGGAATAATGKAIGVIPALIDSLQIGSMKVLNHACMVVDKKDLEFKVLGVRVLKIDGIIGWNLLQELDVAIRNKTGTIELNEPESKIGGDHNFFWLDQPLIACKDSSGSDCLFFIDTGASSSGVYQTFINKSDTSRLVKKEVTVGSAGGTRKLRTFVLPRIRLNVGGSSVLLKNVSVFPQENDQLFPCDGVLGINTFNGHSIHFNILRGFFAIED